jgi:hypothetical protein
VFREAHRVMKPGARLMISDVMLRQEIPAPLRENAELFAGCVSGAVLKDDYLEMMKKAGFTEVTIVRETESGAMFGPDEEARLLEQAPGVSGEELRRLGKAVVSVQLTARA